MAEGGEPAAQNLYDPSEEAVIHKDPGYVFLIVNGIARPAQKDTSATRDAMPDKKKRKGAKADIDSFRVVFQEKFGMKWINKATYRELTSSDFDHDLKPQAIRKSAGTSKETPDGTCQCICCKINRLDFSSTDKLVLVISSEGLEEGEPVIVMNDGTKIRRTDIIKGLGDIRCPALIGKLRIILMCCCRRDKRKPGKDDDRGVPLKVDTRVQTQADFHALRDADADHEDEEGCVGDVEEKDGEEGDKGEEEKENGEEKEKGEEEEEEEEEEEVEEEDGSTDDNDDDDDSTDEDSDDARSTGTGVALGMPPDFMFVYSVPIGRSKRTTDEGTWMIKELVNSANDDHFDKNIVNFMQVVTLTNKRVCDLSSEVYKKKNKTKGKQDRFVRDEKGKRVLDPKKSELKNTMCVEHRLTKKVFFRTPELPLPEPLAIAPIVNAGASREDLASPNTDFTPKHPSFMSSQSANMDLSDR